ncbi:MAG: hypothetical protein OXI87_04350 [Albidovulum sp.]|nr:hypothetical protein [Albidovulum sp.]MDE0533374.1 hypothetical protein [Albidovulum sp.]
MAKSILATASVSRAVGSTREIVETLRQEFDVAGYYLVKGLAFMAARARALGYSSRLALGIFGPSGARWRRQLIP